MSDEPIPLMRKLRHRELLSDLGTEALRIRDLEPLLAAACDIVANGMDTKFCKVLEYQPARDRLLVRAGVGWHAGVVGHAELEADTGSPAGLALKTGAPVISNDVQSDDRFRTPKLLLDHGIHRAMNVIIQGDNTAYGVLEADARRPGTFVADDTAFMQAAANLLGLAIERCRRVTELEGALATNALLLREADHRIKNSLQLVASLLSLQRSKLSDPGAVAAIESAISRVGAVAEAHRALNRSNDLRFVAFDKMLVDLCNGAAQFNPSVAVHCSTEGELEIDAERAIPLGLIASELLTNASRHAYAEGQVGTIVARAAHVGGCLEVSIADTGRGMASPAAGRASTLGTTIMQALTRQIGAEMRTETQPGQGTSVTLRLPMQGSAPRSV